VRRVYLVRSQLRIVGPKMAPEDGRATMFYHTPGDFQKAIVSQNFQAILSGARTFNCANVRAGSTPFRICPIDFLAPSAHLCIKIRGSAGAASTFFGKHPNKQSQFNPSLRRSSNPWLSALITPQRRFKQDPSFPEHLPWIVEHQLATISRRSSHKCRIAAVS